MRVCELNVTYCVSESQWRRGYIILVVSQSRSGGVVISFLLCLRVAVEAWLYHSCCVSESQWRRGYIILVRLRTASYDLECINLACPRKT
jgi:hypothetical protein